MLTEAAIYKNLDKEYQFIIQQILLIIEQEFPDEKSSSLENLFLYFIDLYEGEIFGYQKCQTGYHNLRHAIEVALVSARMAAGHNIIVKSSKLIYNHFKIALTASLFHDAGYLKDSGDDDGSVGGKYTFSHVERSKKIAEEYCSLHNFEESDQHLITRVIDTTEFATIPDVDKIFTDETNRTIACIVGTADLIAQMADVNYMENIHHLFDEFSEAYSFHDQDQLEKKGMVIYSSSEEMIQNTALFYEKFVIPRLEAFGRQDKYLISFFGEGRNPYMENITANISGKKDAQNIKWRRIGDILQDFGMVDNQQIDNALVSLNNFHASHRQAAEKKIPFQIRFQTWLHGTDSTKTLGDVLLEKKAVQPSFLRCALIDQILPQSLIDNLNNAEAIFLLHISVMLHNVAKDPWIFEQILEMANDLTSCYAGSILLADLDRREMTLAVSTLKNKQFTVGSRTPLDKGLSGWVFLHDKPAMVANVATDDRLDFQTDMDKDLTPNSILTVPLHINGAPIGVMEFLHINDMTFTDSDTVIMTLLANVITSSLNNALSS